VAGAAAGGAQRRVGGGGAVNAFRLSVRADDFLSTFRAMKNSFWKCWLISHYVRQAISLSAR